MKNLTDFLRKTVETSVDPRLQCSSLPHVLSQRPKLTGSGLFCNIRAVVPANFLGKSSL